MRAATAVQKHGGEELPHVQAQGLRLRFSGATVKRYQRPR